MFWRASCEALRIFFPSLFMDEPLTRGLVTADLEKYLGVVTLESHTDPSVEHYAVIRISMFDREGRDTRFITLCSCQARELIAKLEQACQEADALDDRRHP